MQQIMFKYVDPVRASAYRSEATSESARLLAKGYDFSRFYNVGTRGKKERKKERKKTKRLDNKFGPS
jgi:hypothetical protein